MRRPRLRKLHYSARTLHDGTILAAFPMRKPSPHVIRRDHLRIDDDGVAKVFSGAGQELSDIENETRMRFQDIIANRLNTRRAIRDLLLPPIIGLQTEVAELRGEIAELKALLLEVSAV